MKYIVVGIIGAMLFALVVGVAQATPNENGRPNQEETGCNSNNPTNCPTPEQPDGVNPICGNGQHTGNPHCNEAPPETPPETTPEPTVEPTPDTHVRDEPESSETPQDEPETPSVTEPEVILPTVTPPVGSGEPFVPQVSAPIPAAAGNCGPECK